MVVTTPARQERQRADLRVESQHHAGKVGASDIGRSGPGHASRARRKWHRRRIGADVICMSEGRETFTYIFEIVCCLARLLQRAFHY